MVEAISAKRIPLGYVGFDLETANAFPEGSDWRSHRPLGITCAALWGSDKRKEVRYSCGPDGAPLAQMTREDVSGLVDRLLDIVEMGYQITTWNGLGFDFDVLAEESGRRADCVRIARAHTDMMIHVFCVKGYPLGLTAAAAGAGLDGKVEGMNGADAVRMWAEGQHGPVLEYVLQDARVTAEIARTCQDNGRLEWISQSARPQWVDMPAGWLSVADALALPEPDTSWMTSPLSRSSFTDWMDTDRRAV